MRFSNTNLISLSLAMALVACVTPTKPSLTSQSLGSALVKETGFISIAGPNGIAQAEFTMTADFAKASGEWNSKPIADVDGFLDSDTKIQLFGAAQSDKIIVFTDVEDYSQNKDRDPAIAVYFEGEKLQRIVYGGWPSFISGSRDELKKIKRIVGKYLVNSENEELNLRFSLVIDWNQTPPKGTFFQSHVETEGRVPEEVEIADQWSFTSSAIRVEEAKCKGCSSISINRLAAEDGTPAANDFVIIEIGPDQKPRSIKAGGLAAKLGK